MSGSRPKILGAGLVALDLVVSPDPTTPIRAWAGGTCGNVIAILAWHGWDSYPIARMSGDAASKRVRADLSLWGVHLELAGCTPVSNTPIIVQEIRRPVNGKSTHKFSWACPGCGGGLPSFKAVTQDAVEQAAEFIPGASVFFLDRVSRGTLQLASRAAESGALVFFEPSSRGEPRLFAEALELAHVVKYASQRIAELADASPNRSRILEVQTLGSSGLRYRTPSRKGGGDWRALDAIPIEQTVDSCGAGDWCTAGLIAMTAAGGRAGAEDLTLKEVHDGLMYGQQLAAWNCGFEGARGGMYTKSVAKAPLMTKARKPRAATGHGAASSSSGVAVSCPNCVVA